VTDQAEPSRETLLWAAQRTIAQHATPDEVFDFPDSPRCTWCLQDDRCRQLVWAEVILHGPTTTTEETT
jgi:hypothetical protein